MHPTIIKRLLFQMGIITAATLVLACNQSSTDQQPTAQIPPLNQDSDWALLPFKKIDSANPVLKPGKGIFVCPIKNQPIYWEEKDVFNPAVLVRGDTLYMLYRAEDKIGKPDGTSRIGLATSSDGLHFSTYPHPVLFPDNDPQKKYEWEGGCEDPRITQDENGQYYMTYTAFDGNLARLMIATSADLTHWVKWGPVFAKAYQGKYLNKWSKSGSIVSTYQEGKIQATKIDGKYWMYWGDQNIWLATSDDLIHWEPLEMKPGEKPLITLKGQAIQLPDLKIIIPTRPGKFDADLVESGPPAILTDKGILLLYNGRDSAGTYTSGQVLMDKQDPTKILHRMDGFFMKPDRPYEIQGQVNNVCFLEGLARFKNKWFLYYGTADSKIAVAVKE
jgi:beta-1,2-mannosidase